MEWFVCLFSPVCFAFQLQLNSLAPPFFSESFCAVLMFDSQEMIQNSPGHGRPFQVPILGMVSSSIRFTVNVILGG